MEWIDDEQLVMDDCPTGGQSFIKLKVAKFAPDFLVGQSGRTNHRNAAALKCMRRPGRNFLARVHL